MWLSTFVAMAPRVYAAIILTYYAINRALTPEKWSLYLLADNNFVRLIWPAQYKKDYMARLNNKFLMTLVKTFSENLP